MDKRAPWGVVQSHSWSCRILTPPALMSFLQIDPIYFSGHQIFQALSKGRVLGSKHSLDCQKELVRNARPKETECLWNEGNFSIEGTAQPGSRAP